jgi:hypothetical protein
MYVHEDELLFPQLDEIWKCPDIALSVIPHILHIAAQLYSTPSSPTR